MNLTPSTLAAALADDADDAGITITTQLEPVAGAHAPVKPAGYAGGMFQEDTRWFGDPPTRTAAVIIDNTPSQANRLERGLRGVARSAGLPELVLDLSGIETLPTHLPHALSSLDFPHRHADAYLRDSLLDGVAFSRTPLGAALIDATHDRCDPLLAWFPQGLLYGYWVSHAGKKRSQAKLARSWTSEIVGYDPATAAESRTRGLGLKGDPLNLSVDEPADFDETDLMATDWSLTEGVKKDKPAAGKSRKALSEIGHGQVPFKASEAALSAVSFRAIEQLSTVSFAGLRRLSLADPTHNGVMRALVAAIGLLAHVEAFGRAFHLRSRCDLRPASASWMWLGGASDESIEPLSREAAAALLCGCRDAAAGAGLLGGGGWGSEPLVLRPASGLEQAIRKTWPLGSLDV